MEKIENNLSEGSVLKKLVMFAIPFLISNIVQSFYNVADMLVVGNFCGTESLSGVTIGGQFTVILTNVIIGLCVGGTVLIGQYVGSNSREALKRVTATLITLLLILSLIIMVVMLTFRDTALHLIRTPPESYSEGSQYYTVTMTGIVFIFAYNALSAILRGMGDSKHPFYFVLIACITNIIMDLVFVCVFDMAAFGVGLATVISQALSVFLCVAYMIRNKFVFDFKPSSFRIYKDQLKLIIRFGLPTSAQNGVISLSFLFITSLVNTVGGVTASAAVGAWGQFNGFAFMPTQAIGASVSTMSAQNIGAGRLDRAVQSCKIGIAFAVPITFLFFVLVRVFPAQILSLFGRDPEMIQAGITYISAFSYDFFFIPFAFCINGFLIGGGHTVYTLINSMVSSVLLRAPVCYFLGVGLHWGLFGVGLGAPVASVGAMVMTVVYLMSGKWRENAVQSSSSGVEI